MSMSKPRDPNRTRRVPSGAKADAQPLDWQRWTPAALVSPVAAAADAPQLEPVDAGELQRLREEAQASGHAAGFAAGRDEGLAAGHHEGHASGYAAGHSEAQSDVAAQAHRLAGLASSFDNALSAIDKEVAQTLVTLSLEIAAQVVRGTLATTPERVLDVVREALLSEPPLSGDTRLHVHPDDAELFDAHLRDALHDAGWSVAEDMSIEPGGCLVQAADGAIDATVGTRWRRVAASLGSTQPWQK